MILLLTDLIYNTSSSFIIRVITIDMPAAPKQQRAGSGGGGVHHYISASSTMTHMSRYWPSNFCGILVWKWPCYTFIFASGRQKLGTVADQFPSCLNKLAFFRFPILGDTGLEGRPSSTHVLTDVSTYIVLQHTTVCIYHIINYCLLSTISLYTTAASARTVVTRPKRI